MVTVDLEDEELSFLLTLLDETSCPAAPSLLLSCLQCKLAFLHNKVSLPQGDNSSFGCDEQVSYWVLD